jgi:hypothetical protein
VLLQSALTRSSPMDIVKSRRWTHGNPWVSYLEINYSLQVRQRYETYFQGRADSLASVGGIQLRKYVVKMGFNWGRSQP